MTYYTRPITVWESPSAWVVSYVTDPQSAAKPLGLFPKNVPGARTRAYLAKRILAKWVDEYGEGKAL